MQNLSNWACFAAFALGFTLGNYFGILIEKKLALGMAIIASSPTATLRCSSNNSATPTSASPKWTDKGRPAGWRS